MVAEDLRSKLKGILWIGIAAIVACGFFVGLPFFVRRVPWSFETFASNHLGIESLLSHFECNESGDSESNRLFQKMITRLYPLYPTDSKFPLNVQVIRGKTVNAFAFLGGQIYVYQGLIDEAESPEELAGVIAHEVEHVRQRHILYGLFVRLMTYAASQIMSSNADLRTEWTRLLELKFNRDQEEEADEFGLKRLNEAHIDVRGFQQFFERMKTGGSVQTIVSDHPSSESRSRLVERYIKTNIQPVMSQKEWLVLKRYVAVAVEEVLKS